MKSRLTILLSVLFLISCNDTKVTREKTFDVIINDTFSYEQIQLATKILNYSFIGNGVDSLEIRLWSSLGHSDINFVKVIKYENSNWHVSLTRYWYSGDSTFPNRGSKIYLDSGIIEYAKLRTPVSEVIDTLISMDLVNFPTQSQIPGHFDNMADGWYYDIEISTKSYYKHLFYHGPEHFNDSIDRKFVKILDLLSLTPN